MINYDRLTCFSGSGVFLNLPRNFQQKSLKRCWASQEKNVRILVLSKHPFFSGYFTFTAVQPILTHLHIHINHQPQMLCVWNIYLHVSYMYHKCQAIVQVHPGRLTWNIIIEVWKIIFLSKWVICMFHVYLPGCKYSSPIERLGNVVFSTWPLFFPPTIRRPSRSPAGGAEHKKSVKKCRVSFFGVEPKNTTVAAKPRFVKRFLLGLVNVGTYSGLVEVGTRWGLHQL